MNKTFSASLYGGPILSNIVYRRNRLYESKIFVSRFLNNFIKGGLNSLFIPAESLDEIAILYKEFGESKSEFVIVKSAFEANNALHKSIFSCVLAASYQTIGSNIDYLEILKELGVRLFTISGNRRNLYTDGCAERESLGLSYSGIELVGKLEDMNILIDVSHTSDKGIQDVLDVTSKAIVVASHSNSRYICDNPRNLTDEQIQAIAERGGMIGLSMHPTLVSWDNPNITNVIKHVIYIKNLVGPDHLGIGTDYVDYISDTFKHKIISMDPSGKIYRKKLSNYPEGLETVSKMGNLFRALKKEGLDDETINKIKGENIFNILKRITY